MSKKPESGSEKFNEQWIIVGDESSGSGLLKPVNLDSLIKQQKEEDLKAKRDLISSKAACFSHLLTAATGRDHAKVSDLIKERKMEELKEIQDLVFSKTASSKSIPEVISKIIALQGSNNSELDQDYKLAACSLDYSKNLLHQVKQKQSSISNEVIVEPDMDSSFFIDVIPHPLPSNSLQKIQEAQEEQNKLLKEQNQLMRAQQSQSVSEQPVSRKKKGQPVTKAESFINERESGGFQDVKSVSVKERNKMLAVILGVAIDKYGYSPEAKRNEATGGKANSIKAGLEKIGLDIDEDTIKNYLKEAYEIHRDSIDSKKS